MRLIFTGYAINAAALCFLLTSTLAFTQSEQTIEKVALYLFTYTYVTFGPLLLLFSVLGITEMRGLMFQCGLTHISNHVNVMDVFIVIGCTVFSGLVTLFFSLHRSIEEVQIQMRDENSVIYRLFLRYLKHKRLRGNMQSMNNSDYGTISDQWRKVNDLYIDFNINSSNVK